MNIIDFLIQLRRSISEFTETTSNTEKETVTDRRDQVLKFELAIMYYNIIEYYFRDTGVVGDENIMTQEEIQIVIDKLNNIMDTYLYTDFS